MQMTADELASEIGRAAKAELRDAVQKIKHCLKQLDDGQIWWRPVDNMNSIANLMLHLAGNLRQWIIAGVGGVADMRDRPAEFADRSGRSNAELAELLDETIREVEDVLDSVTANELVRPRRVQGFEVTGAQAICGSIAHFRGHSQEIVHLTRTLLGTKYEFEFVPRTPEQGAPEGSA